MNINRYLERIRYEGVLSPTIEVLSALQQVHLLRVPFENLDIHEKIPIDLDNTYEKIVVRNRGGFCYELNSLFYRLLRELGFRVKMISARVYSHEKGFGPEFDHLAIIATINDTRYMVDVGFGEFALHPLKIKLHTDLPDPRGVFRMEPHENSYLVVKKKGADGNFMPEYIFSEQERSMEEFFEMCRFHQASPESHFTRKRICSLATLDGRITLTENILKITAAGQVTEKQLDDETEIQKALGDYFHIMSFP